MPTSECPLTKALATASSPFRVEREKAPLEQGDLNGPYDFTTAIEEMKPWNDMTPDEQAEIAMVIGEALEADANGELTDVNLEAAIDAHNGGGRGAIDITPDHLEYLKNIHNILEWALALFLSDWCQVARPDSLKTREAPSCGCADSPVLW